jgi:LysM domain
VLLTVAAALAMALNTTTSILPPTQPGLGADEGVFLQTVADNGDKIEYFIAQGARHAIQDDDLQAELRINPLWPYRAVSRDEVLAFPEGAPIGNAPTGRVHEQVVAEDDSVQVADESPQVAADEPDDAQAADEDADGEEQTYTVKRGDTLIGIARRFGVTEADLMAENNIPNRNRIYAGQTLTIS